MVLNTAPGYPFKQPPYTISVSPLKPLKERLRETLRPADQEWTDLDFLIQEAAFFIEREEIKALRKQDEPLVKASELSILGVVGELTGFHSTKLTAFDMFIDEQQLYQLSFKTELLPASDQMRYTINVMQTAKHPYLPSTSGASTRIVESAVAYSEGHRSFPPGDWITETVQRLCGYYLNLIKEQEIKALT